MDAETSIDRERIEIRQRREDMNVFARMPSICAASRTQSQKLLQIGGGLSIVEWRTLWDLHEVGAATIGDLSTMQRTDHSLLSRALPEMRRKGLIAMRRDPGDGRQSIVTLTSKGRDAYARAAPVMARRRAALRDVFSKDEIETLLGFLDRFEAFLKIPVDQIADKDAPE